MKNSIKADSLKLSSKSMISMNFSHISFSAMEESMERKAGETVFLRIDSGKSIWMLPNGLVLFLSESLGVACFSVFISMVQNKEINF